MRFSFVDRILSCDAGRAIEIIKNVSSTEDIFEDHFPGCPILPGALIIETFEQATQLLIGETHGFERIGRLQRISRAAFHQFVRPGDQLRVRCQRQEGPEADWQVSASASVEGRQVATAVLEFTLERAAHDADARTEAERLRELARVLRQDPRAASGWGGTP